LLLVAARRKSKMSIKTYAPLAALLIAACIPDPEISAPDAGIGAAPPYDGVDIPPRPGPVEEQPDAGTGKVYGEFCVKNGDCESNLCHENECTVACSFEAVNDCREQDAFCVPTHFDGSVCFGHVDTGGDVGDDAMLEVGDSLTAKLAPVGDADLFQATLPAGKYLVVAEPSKEVDVRLEVYNQLAKQDASSDTGGLGAAEQAVIDVREEIPRYFFVVKSVGGADSSFTIRVTPQP
jgi:hypothetical protein